MSQIKIEAFVSIPPCSGGVAMKRLLAEMEAEYADMVAITYYTGPDDPVMQEKAITNAPALIIGDLVKFVGLVPSRSSMIAALHEAGLTELEE